MGNKPDAYKHVYCQPQNIFSLSFEKLFVTNMILLGIYKSLPLKTNCYNERKEELDPVGTDN